MSIRIEDATKEDFMTLSLKELRGLIKKKDLKNAIPGFSTSKKPDLIKRLVKYFTCKKVQKEKGVKSLFDNNKPSGPKKKKGCSKCDDCQRQLTPQEKATEIADRRVEEAEQMRLYREARERGEVAPIITPINRGEDRGRGRPQRPTEIIEEFDLDDDADIPPPSMIPMIPTQPEPTARKEKQLEGPGLRDLIKSAVTAGIIAHQGIKGARADRARRLADPDIDVIGDAQRERGGFGPDFPDIPPEFHEEARQTRQEVLRRFNEQVSNPTGILTREQALQKLEDLERAQALRRQQNEQLIRDRLIESTIPDDIASGIGGLSELGTGSQLPSISGIAEGQALPFSDISSIGGVGVGRPLPFSEASTIRGGLSAPTIGGGSSVGSVVPFNIETANLEQLQTFLDSIPELEEGGFEQDLTPEQIALREIRRKAGIKGGKASNIIQREKTRKRERIEEQKKILKESIPDSNFRTKEQKNNFISSLARDIVEGTVTPESFQIEKQEPTPRAFEMSGRGIRGKGVGLATKEILESAKPAELAPEVIKASKAETKKLTKLANQEEKALLKARKQLEKIRNEFEKKKSKLQKEMEKAKKKPRIPRRGKQTKPKQPPRPKK